jgi:signal transduction histidine kinase
VVESRWAALRGPDHELAGFMEVNRDVTARRAAEREARWKTAEVQALNESLERQIEQRTEHLERANRNLESFAYSVAHDLRTPLRGMSGFAEALVEDYHDCLDEAGRDYAGRIQMASQRMATLIDDLLHLARVSRAEITPEPVNLSEEAAVICEQLRAADPVRQAQITIQPGIVVSADRGLIRLVLGNLLENAWKFTATQEEARIEFGTAVVGDGTCCCVVRDNGVGFDPAYAHKLFQPFQRLHVASDFPGTGIGLASVRQIVERHGGRAWAESTAGTGASFYFSLST